MSFALIMAGIGELATGLALCIFTAMGLINATIAAVGFLVMGVIFGLILALVGILANGVVGPAMSAKMSNNHILQVMTSAKKLRWFVCKEKRGMAETKFGRFLINPNTVYTLPNGVRSEIAYRKYATTLQPQFIKACTQLRKADITDMGQLMNVANEVKQNGAELIIPLVDEAVTLKPGQVSLTTPEMLANIQAEQEKQPKEEPQENHDVQEEK